MSVLHWVGCVLSQAALAKAQRGDVYDENREAIVLGVIVGLGEGPHENDGFCHGFSHGKSHGFPFSHDFPFSHGFPMVFPWVLLSWFAAYFPGPSWSTHGVEPADRPRSWANVGKQHVSTCLLVIRYGIFLFDKNILREHLLYCICWKCCWKQIDFCT